MHAAEGPLGDARIDCMAKAVILSLRHLFGALLFAVAALALVACGGSGGTDQGATPAPKATTRVTRPSASPTPDPNAAVSAKVAWNDAKAQAQIGDTCFNSVNKDPNSQRFCVEQLMQSMGASQDAISFYDTAGYWVTSLVESQSQVKAGFIIKPGDSKGIPRLAFFNSQPRFQTELDLRNTALPDASQDGAAPFRADPSYPALLDAAKRKFANGDDPLKLMHFDNAMVESANIISRGVQEFVIQVGIHNFCDSCGVGVAARYAFDFDVANNFAGAKLLGLCQGRTATQTIEGFGKVPLHDFSGVAAGKAGVSEPYLLTVSSLSQCPAHVGG